jgi:hypothetical protein
LRSLLKPAREKPMKTSMAGKRRQGVIISLDDRRRKRQQESLAEANRNMIEAEHALFAALRLAGHRGASSAPAGKLAQVLVLPIRPRRKRAA